MRSLALVLALLNCAASAAEAHQRTESADADPVVLRGRVFAAGSTIPVPRAQVVLVAGGRAYPPAFTDAQGIFAIAAPASGPSALRVTKAGFAPEEMTLTAESAPGIVQIGLARGAVVTGRVSDPSGEPLAGITVHVRRAEGSSAATDAASSYTTDTDDLGQYRVGSLPAGRYEVAPGAAAGRLDVLLRERRVALAARLGPEARRGAAEPPAASVQGARAVELGTGEEAFVELVLDGPPLRPVPAIAAGSARGASAAAGSITGHVVGPNGRTVSGAVVRLTTVDGTGSHTGISDDDGRYEILGVPAGSFRMSASRTGYVSAAYGQGSGGQGTVITVRENQRLERMVIALQRTAVMTGTVLDASGEPVEGVTVHAWQTAFRFGRTALVPAAVQARRTDDRGQYRLYGFQPGRYYVVVTDDGASRRDSGAAAPEHTLTMSSLRVEGAHAFMMGVSSIASAQGGPRAFYPGHASVEAALPVTVGVGLDAFGIDVVFAPAPSARVSGSVLQASGEPFRGSVTLSVSGRSGAPLLPPQQTATGADGAFEFLDVPFGDYVVQASGMSMHVSRAPAPPGNAGRVVWGRSLAGVSQFGSQYVTVNGPEVPPVVLRMTSDSTIRGRISLEGDGSGTPFSRFQLSAVPADQDHAPEAPLRATIAADGTFEMRGLLGPLRFVGGDVPDGWWLESVMVGGANAVNDPVVFGGRDGSHENVHVVFSRTAGEISGRVLDDRPQDEAPHAVILFPADRSRWFDRGLMVDPRVHHLRLARPDRSGTFTFASLPPGEYYVVGVESREGDAISRGEWQNPDLLNALVPSARSVSLREGQQTSLELRLVPLPDP